MGDLAFLADGTARKLGLPDQEVTQIRLAAELHDIGKSAIPDAVLGKPRLTPASGTSSAVTP